ncbi:hypothetical protein M9H77_07191 [Catharanthus roseus]|uniref:Uncharacterized protein n=1 Tax=Catharanthus roseus TaxID=4058 RepID=A0ACC0BUI0_CATRO|nr:hypothetical protein M9H77_07191 [Catharanthus roseus]
MERVPVRKKELKNNPNFCDPGVQEKFSSEFPAKFRQTSGRTLAAIRMGQENERNSLVLDEENQVYILPSEEDRLWDHSAGGFQPIKKTTQTDIRTSSLQPVEDDNEANESYNPSDDEEDKAGAQNTILMDAFQIEMQTAFEQLQINQEIQGMQLTETVESTSRYADELANQRASIDRQEVMLARLYQRFMPNQGSSGGGGTDFGYPTIAGGCRGWQALARQRPTTDGRPRPTVCDRLDYLQGCLELKKKEQSRATNWVNWGN